MTVPNAKTEPTQRTKSLFCVTVQLRHKPELNGDVEGVQHVTKTFDHKPTYMFEFSKEDVIDWIPQVDDSRSGDAKYLFGAVKRAKHDANIALAEEVGLVTYRDKEWETIRVERQDMTE